MQIRKGKRGFGPTWLEPGELSRGARGAVGWMDFPADEERDSYVPPLRYQSADVLSLATSFDRTLTSLEERSHRPRQCRQPTWSFLRRKVLGLRCSFRVGQRQLRFCSAPEVGGFGFYGGPHSHSTEAARPVVEPPRPEFRDRDAPSASPLRRAQPRNTRLPSRRPGRSRTLDVRPIPGVVFKQFTARDVVSRWDVLQAHPAPRSKPPLSFLDTLQHRMPFYPGRADHGGPEFAADSNRPAKQRGLHLFVLPPRSPKLNGAVERATAPTPRSSTTVTAARWR